MNKRIFVVIGLAIIPFAYAYYIYPSLPYKIPIHFNLEGKADGWGSKESIYLLPSIMGFVSIFVYLLMANVKKLIPKDMQVPTTRSMRNSGFLQQLFYHVSRWQYFMELHTAVFPSTS